MVIQPHSQGRLQAVASRHVYSSHVSSKRLIFLNLHHRVFQKSKLTVFRPEMCVISGMLLLKAQTGGQIHNKLGNVGSTSHFWDVNSAVLHLTS
jgi:hypothetical protein